MEELGQNMKTIFLVLGLALLAATVARAQIGGSLEKFGRLIGGEETAPEEETYISSMERTVQKLAPG